MTDGRDEMDRFDAALRGWGARAPRMPADAAAARVVERIGQRSARGEAGVRARQWVMATAAAALVALVAGAAWLWRDAPPAAPPASGAVDLPPALPENVVQFWLDSQTPVYFVTGPLQGPRGGTP